MLASEILAPEDATEGGDDNFVQDTSHPVETTRVDRESLFVSPKLACHIRAAHGMDVASYRREVLRRSLAEWPVDIPA